MRMHCQYPAVLYTFPEMKSWDFRNRLYFRPSIYNILLNATLLSKMFHRITINSLHCIQNGNKSLLLNC